MENFKMEDLKKKDLKKLGLQIIKFGGTGGLCFIIDFGIMTLLTESLGIDVLLSSAVSFSVSVIVNYLLSVRFVFNDSHKHGRIWNFIWFIILSIIGLLVNELIMHIGANMLKYNYMLVKVGATFVVMMFNFISRKLLLE